MCKWFFYRGRRWWLIAYYSKSLTFFGNFINQKNYLWSAIHQSSLELAVLISNSLPCCILSIFILREFLLKSIFDFFSLKNFQSIASKEKRFLFSITFLLNVIHNWKLNDLITNQLIIKNYIGSKMSKKPPLETCQILAVPLFYSA